MYTAVLVTSWAVMSVIVHYVLGLVGHMVAVVEEHMLEVMDKVVAVCCRPVVVD